MTRELTAATEHAGVRLDAFLSADGALTRSQAARLIAEGRVRVNGKPAAKSARLSGGETVTVDVPQLRETALPPQDIPLDVVYEDEDVIVVNKPVGMVVHPAPGHPDGTLVNALLHHCGDSLSGIGGEKRPGIVHRIDRDTSGLIIAAKNDAAHLALAAQLADHTLARTYECLSVGSFRQDSGTVRLGGEDVWENAALKAKAIMAASGLPAIADDSGLCVNWLNGAPGVYSARYGGLDDDAARYRLLLQNLRGATDRSAYFHTAIVCAFPNGDVLTAEGDCHGAIAFAPMGDGGFGYDPVFLVPSLRKTFAQLTPEEKNAISHRGNALRTFAAELREYLTNNGSLEK